MADWAALKAEGNDAYKKGEFKAAQAKYTEALTVADLSGADRATLLSNRAQCFVKMGEHAAAVEDCTAALELDSANVKAQFRRAVSREAMGDKKGAIADYRDVLAAQPGQVECRRALMRLDPEAAESASAARARKQRKLSPDEVSALQEAQGEAVRMQRQVQQAKQRAAELARRQRIMSITRSEVSKSAEDASLFQHVGKMFVRVPRATHLKRLDAEKASLDKQQAGLERMAEGLQAKAKAANGALRELADAAGVRIAVPGESA